MVPSRIWLINSNGTGFASHRLVSFGYTLRRQHRERAIPAPVRYVRALGTDCARVSALPAVALARLADEATRLAYPARAGKIVYLAITILPTELNVTSRFSPQGLRAVAAASVRRRPRRHAHHPCPRLPSAYGISRSTVVRRNRYRISGGVIADLPL